jgi:hypothetical protein
MGEDAGHPGIGSNQMLTILSLLRFYQHDHLLYALIAHLTGMPESSSKQFMRRESDQSGAEPQSRRMHIHK